jgi:hypothetical protein
MAVLPVQDSSLAGITPAPSALNSGGDSFANNGHVLLELINASGGAITVDADDVGSPAPANAQAFDPDVQISVPAGQRRIWGPFPPFRFNDANGRVNLTYGTNPPTGLTIGFYRTRSS